MWLFDLFKKKKKDTFNADMDHAINLEKIAIEKLKNGKKESYEKLMKEANKIVNKHLNS